MTSLFADDDLKNAPPEPLPPRENSYLLGLETTEAQLMKAYHSGRMHHAWLIAGPKGIGKATLAYRFARYVLTTPENAPGESLYMLPNHPVFRKVAAGGYPDLIVVERSVNDKGRMRGEIVVEDVRRIAPFFGKTAAAGGWRVVIVDGVELMNQNAANALLKVLEEPPKQTLLLLVSHNPGKLLPTIRSRCLRLDIRPLTADDMETLLGFYTPDLELDERLRLVRLGEGRIGRALDLAQFGGLQLYRDLTELLSSLPVVDLKALDAFAAKVAKTKSTDEAGSDGFAQFRELFPGWLRHLILVASIGADHHFHEMEPDQVRYFRRLSELTTLDRLLQLWDKVGHSLNRTDQVHLDRKQVVVTLILNLEEALQRS